MRNFYTYDYHIGVFINPGQEHLVAEFTQLSQQQNFSDFTTLNIQDFSTIGALIQQAKFLISGDTGLIHIAFGVKTPTLVIFTHTRLEHVWPEDVTAIACFIEDESKVNEYGIKLGKNNIPINYIKECIVELESKLSSQ